MNNDNNGKAIITLFSELSRCGVEIWLSQEGWLQYEILLENENILEEKVG